MSIGRIRVCLSSPFGFRSGIMIFFRSVRDDITSVKSIVLLFKRNSIPPVALPVDEKIDLLGSLDIDEGISSDFGITRGVMMVSVRTVG